MVSIGQLLLARQGISLYRQLADGFFRRVGGIGEIAGEQAQGIVIHSASRHDLRLQQEKLCGPTGIGYLELPRTQFGFLLTFCQIATLKELHGTVIRSLGAAGACVFKRNQQQQQKQPRVKENPEWKAATRAAKPLPDTRLS